MSGIVCPAHGESILFRSCSVCGITYRPPVPKNPVVKGERSSTLTMDWFAQRMEQPSSGSGEPFEITDEDMDRVFPDFSGRSEV